MVIGDVVRIEMRCSMIVLNCYLELRNVLYNR
jgi:hypothetical protein